MNQQIENLYALAGKPSRCIIGLMSGTSLDGLDVALCNIEGSGTNTKVKMRAFESIAYDATFKAEVRSIFSVRQVDLQQVCLLNKWIGRRHAAFINDCLEKWEVKAESIDLIASHGQTIYHAPLALHQQTAFGNATLQIGDGDEIAVRTGIITISDFRQKHISGGGEGAPLAAYGDFLLFKDDHADVILLNIGGISNFSFIPSPGSAVKMFSTDVGPGNTLMDAFVRRNFNGIPYDEEAKIANSGKVNEALLSALQADEFFNVPLPKTTGPELFNLDFVEAAQRKSNTPQLNAEDIMATLNAFTATTIVNAVLPLKSNMPLMVYITGGGARNPLLVRQIKAGLSWASFHDSAEKNIDADAKEAILFAILANECVAGNPASYPKGIKNFPAISMGKISFPS